MGYTIRYTALLIGMALVGPSLASRAAQGKLVGKPAPAFSARGLDGKPLSLQAHKGSVVLLNFWDFGCSSCNLEVTHLEWLHRKYRGQGLRVIGIVGVESDATKVKQFLQQYEATYPVALDPDQKVARQFGLTAHPLTVVIDRKGFVRFVHSGFLKGDEKTLEDAVRGTLEGARIASARP